MQMMLSELVKITESAQSRTPQNPKVQILKVRSEGSSTDFAYAVIEAAIDSGSGPITIRACFFAGPQTVAANGWYLTPEIDHKSSGIDVAVDVLDDICEEDEPGWMKPIAKDDIRLKGLAEDCWSYWDIEPDILGALPKRQTATFEAAC